MSLSVTNKNYADMPTLTGVDRPGGFADSIGIVPNPKAQDTFTLSAAENDGEKPGGLIGFFQSIFNGIGSFFKSILGMGGKDDEDTGSGNGDDLLDAANETSTPSSGISLGNDPLSRLVQMPKFQGKKVTIDQFVKDSFYDVTPLKNELKRQLNNSGTREQLAEKIDTQITERLELLEKAKQADSDPEKKNKNFTHKGHSYEVKNKEELAFLEELAIVQTWLSGTDEALSDVSAGRVNTDTKIPLTLLGSLANDILAVDGRSPGQLSDAEKSSQASNAVNTLNNLFIRSYYVEDKKITRTGLVDITDINQLVNDDPNKVARLLYMANLAKAKSPSSISTLLNKIYDSVEPGETPSEQDVYMAVLSPKSSIKKVNPQPVKDLAMSLDGKAELLNSSDKKTLSEMATELGADVGLLTAVVANYSSKSLVNRNVNPEIFASKLKSNKVSLNPAQYQDAITKALEDLENRAK